MSTSKNKKDIKVRLDRIEKIFQKYSLKIVNVEKMVQTLYFLIDQFLKITKIDRNLRAFCSLYIIRKVRRAYKCYIQKKIKCGS